MFQTFLSINCIRRKCDFFAFFLEVQIWNLCAKIQTFQIFYHFNIRILARKFKLVFWQVFMKIEFLNKNWTFAPVCLIGKLWFLSYFSSYSFSYIFFHLFYLYVSFFFLSPIFSFSFNFIGVILFSLHLFLARLLGFDRKKSYLDHLDNQPGKSKSIDDLQKSTWQRRGEE